LAGDSTDLLVIGGGINGCGIARDAVGRGLSVVLCEQGDLAGATSSASSKLIHGGLRYLEYYEFRLVREALQERERLLALAPHIIWPLDFVLPHQGGLRPAWMVRLGLFLYDHLARRRRLPPTRSVRLGTDKVGAPLKPGLDRGFVYADCWVEDSRLVVLNARDAADRGARILTRTRLTAAAREDDVWRCELTTAGGVQEIVRARAVVNAAGPWVGDVLRRAMGQNNAKQARLIKGSHIILPKLHDGDWAYILQNTDRRIVFVIPYEGDYSLIGTTDIPFDGDPSKVEISPAETDYLCAIVNRYFRKQVTPADVVRSYSGVRPLYDDEAENASAVTRDYVLDMDSPADGGTILSVFGGKITTYRRLAEHALEKLQAVLPCGPAWTGSAPLPGGDIPDADFDRFEAGFASAHPFLPPKLALRLARAYGSKAVTVLGGATSLEAMGRDFGGGLHQCEIDYLAAHEWAQTADDILWRRSKLGLKMPPGAAAEIDAALQLSARAA
jgi:glycerol-3-phosphate dehydrogenase